MYKMYHLCSMYVGHGFSLMSTFVQSDDEINEDLPGRFWIPFEMFQIYQIRYTSINCYHQGVPENVRFLDGYNYDLHRYSEREVKGLREKCSIMLSCKILANTLYFHGRSP